MLIQFTAQLTKSQHGNTVNLDTKASTNHFNGLNLTIDKKKKRVNKTSNSIFMDTMRHGKEKKGKLKMFFLQL